MDTASNARPADSTEMDVPPELDFWAIYHPPAGWLVDTCATGAWTWDVTQSLTMGYHVARGTAQSISGDAGIPLSQLYVIRVK